MAANAATVYTSTGSGNWSSNFSSSGSGSPVTYIIQSAHTITVNVNGTSAIDTIKIFGTLNFDNGRKLDLTSNGIVLLETGGSIGAGNGGSKFRFPNGTDISGPFNLSGPLEGAGTFGGSFLPPFLPVEWLGFDITENASQVEVKWETASELNNNYFVVQYSTSGKEWIDGPTVYSKANGGNSSEVLSYTQTLNRKDLNFKEGKCYVRIQQVDFDSKTSYSSVKVIKGNNTPEIKAVLLNNNQFTTTVSNKSGEVSIKVMTLDGNLVLNEQLVPAKHYELIMPGMYLIVFEMNGIATTQKIIVH